MTRKSNKRRLSIPLSIDIYDKIVDDANKMGVSPATYGSIIIGQHYGQLSKAEELLINSLREQLVDLLGSRGINEETSLKVLDDSIEDGKQSVREHLLKDK